MPLNDLTSKVVRVSRVDCIDEEWGNGTTMATLFARKGATNFGFDISLPAAERAASQTCAESPSHNVSVMHGDGTSSTSAKEVVNACTVKHGHRDILVNNVGRSEPNGPE